MTPKQTRKINIKIYSENNVEKSNQAIRILVYSLLRTEAPQEQMHVALNS